LALLVAFEGDLKILYKVVKYVCISTICNMFSKEMVGFKVIGRIMKGPSIPCARKPHA